MTECDKKVGSLSPSLDPNSSWERRQSQGRVAPGAGAWTRSGACCGRQVAVRPRAAAARRLRSRTPPHRGFGGAGSDPGCSSLAAALQLGPQKAASPHSGALNSGGAHSAWGGGGSASLSAPGVGSKRAPPSHQPHSPGRREHLQEKCGPAQGGVAPDATCTGDCFSRFIPGTSTPFPPKSHSAR